MHCRKEREKKLSELTSFTEQLTECELGMEESDLKVSALETQLKNIQKQLEVHCTFLCTYSIHVLEFNVHAYVWIRKPKQSV